MHQSMFNDLPGPGTLLGCCGCLAAVLFGAGILIGWFVWGWFPC